MPHSLRAKLSGLRYKGILEDKDYKRLCRALDNENVLDKIRDEIEQIKAIMNEEIINNNRKDLINFVNGLNQSLVIVERYKGE